MEIVTELRKIVLELKTNVECLMIRMDSCELMIDKIINGRNDKSIMHPMSLEATSEKSSFQIN